ncbi:MAG: hypothetical protein H7318_05555 [Oligoflexus sp.]|nr:hypothetical protein [Oligoflexus sp.]
MYSTSGQVMGITSSGNPYAWVVGGKFYNTYTYHSWIGYAGVKSWIDEALSSDTAKVRFTPFYHGTVDFSDGHYVGELRDGLRTGTGSIIYNDFRTYNGEWSGDKRNGYGEQMWPASNKYNEYKGNWMNDLPDGEGTLIWRDGTKYTGGFKGALYNGKGHIERPNGDIRDGTWALDKMEGEVILTTKDGTKWKEAYSDGKRISAVKI